MGYTIDINNGYILGAGKCRGNGNSNEQEYNAVLSSLQSCPHRDGYGYRLREDLTWEEFELPPATVASDDDELTDEEAYNIIMGVEV